MVSFVAQGNDCVAHHQGVSRNSFTQLMCAAQRTFQPAGMRVETRDPRTKPRSVGILFLHTAWRSDFDLLSCALLISFVF